MFFEVRSLFGSPALPCALRSRPVGARRGEPLLGRTPGAPGEVGAAAGLRDAGEAGLPLGVELVLAAEKAPAAGPGAVVREPRDVHARVRPGRGGAGRLAGARVQAH